MEYNILIETDFFNLLNAGIMMNKSGQGSIADTLTFSLHYFCLQFPCENLILLIKLLIIRKYHHPIV